MQASEDDDESDQGMVEYAKYLYQKEGMGVFLNGIETSAFQSAVEKACYFFAYTALKQAHQSIRKVTNPRAANKPIGGLSNLFLGCLAEWAHLPITLPIDCLSTAIQTSKKERPPVSRARRLMPQRFLSAYLLVRATPWAMAHRHRTRIQ